MFGVEEFLRHGGSSNDFAGYGYDLEPYVYQLRGTTWKPSKISNAFEVIEFAANDLMLDLDTFAELACNSGYPVTSREEALSLLGSGNDLSALHQRLLEFRFKSAFSGTRYQDKFVDSRGDSWCLRRGNFNNLANFAEEDGDLDYEGVRLVNATKMSRYTIGVLSTLSSDFRGLLCDAMAVAGIEDIISRDQAEVWTVLGRLEPDEYDYDEDAHTEIIEKATIVLACELKSALDGSHAEFESLIHLNRGYMSFWDLLLQVEQPSTIDEYSDALQRILEEIG